jgi:hypothetical protein
MMNSPRATHASRSRLLGVARAPLILVLIALVAPALVGAGDPGRMPDLGDCEQLRVPQGNKVAARLFGVGTQNYRWDGTRWVFVAPEAVLFADAGDHGAVAIHFGGPTWESVSGSRVVGAVIDHCTPDPDSIPWLKLEAASTEGPGIFQRVDYIQRLNTVGSIAPAVPGAFPGQVARVPYSADYFFYAAP